MKRLTIHLAYALSQTDQRRGPDGGLLLPVKALDEEGSILAEGAASVDQPAVLGLPNETTQAFVRLTWPSGRTQTQRVSLTGSSEFDLSFSDQSIASNEWSAWAIPRLNPHTQLASGRCDLDLDLQRFDKVWLRLWRYTEGVWHLQRLQPIATYRNGAAWQLDLSLEHAAWLLQLGSSQVPWRFVSLPGGGPARVLFTPKDSGDPRGDPLKVVVTSFRTDAEMLLEFLARDAMRAADTLARSQPLAKKLFAEKFEDPISAVAGAYYLLRRGDWERIPLYWFENLSREFRWLPDASVVHCIRLLREGANARVSHDSPLQLLIQSLQQGWPVYEEGITLLLEAASVLRKELNGDHTDLADKINALGSAKSWAGAATSFYGRQPGSPTALQWVGMPRTPRRRRLDPALRVTPRSELHKELASPGLAEIPRKLESKLRPQVLFEHITQLPEKVSFERITQLPEIGVLEDDEFLLGSIR